MSSLSKQQRSQLPCQFSPKRCHHVGLSSTADAAYEGMIGSHSHPFQPLPDFPRRNVEFLRRPTTRRASVWETRFCDRGCVGRHSRPTIHEKHGRSENCKTYTAPNWKYRMTRRRTGWSISHCTLRASTVFYLLLTSRQLEVAWERSPEEEERTPRLVFQAMDVGAGTMLIHCTDLKTRKK